MSDIIFPMSYVVFPVSEVVFVLYHHIIAWTL